jgi:hypothetical protein
MTDTTLSDSSGAAPDDASIFGPVQITRAMIAVVTILFAMAFYYAAGWIGWPSELKFRGSLAQPPMALGAFVTAIVLLIVLTIIGTLLLGRRWFLAGLMAAVAGMTTWSVRGGTMTQVLFNAENTGVGQAVYLQMLGELIVLFAVIGGIWNVIWQRSGQSLTTGNTAGRLSVRGAAEGVAFFYFAGWLGRAYWKNNRRDQTITTADDDEGRSTLIALVVQLAIMAVLLLLFVVMPMKKQVLTSVFLASLISTAVAEYFFADRKAGRWYWLAPLIVGAFGYIWGYFSPMGIEVGDLDGTFAALTRILPLDYASMGCAGVLCGYWWMEPDAEPGDDVAIIVGPTEPLKENT